MIVHALKHGLAMCVFSQDEPKDWPEGNQWIGFSDQEALMNITCNECRRLLEQERASKTDTW